MDFFKTRNVVCQHCGEVLGTSIGTDILVDPAPMPHFILWCPKCGKLVFKYFTGFRK
jgi:ribosomal protein S27E